MPGGLSGGLPSLWPSAAWASAMVLCWAKAVGEFGATVTLAGTMSFKTETMPIAIFMALASVNVRKTIILILILAGIGLSALYAVRFVEKRPQIL